MIVILSYRISFHFFFQKKNHHFFCNETSEVYIVTNLVQPSCGSVRKKSMASTSSSLTHGERQDVGKSFHCWCAWEFAVLDFLILNQVLVFCHLCIYFVKIWVWWFDTVSSAFVRRFVLELRQSGWAHGLWGGFFGVALILILERVICQVNFSIFAFCIFSGFFQFSWLFRLFVAFCLWRSLSKARCHKIQFLPSRSVLKSSSRLAWALWYWQVWNIHFQQAHGSSYSDPSLWSLVFALLFWCHSAASCASWTWRAFISQIQSSWNVESIALVAFFQCRRSWEFCTHRPTSHHCGSTQGSHGVTHSQGN